MSSPPPLVPGRRKSITELTKKPELSLFQEVKKEEDQEEMVDMRRRRSSISLVQMEMQQVKAQEKKQRIADRANVPNAPETRAQLNPFAAKSSAIADEHTLDFKDDLQKILEESGEQAGDLSAVVKQDRLSHFDKRIAFRNRLHAFLALFSMVVFMAEIWLAYDKPTCWSDPKEIAAQFRSAAKWQTCLQQNIKTYSCKVMMSILTIMLIILIIDYYRIQRQGEKKAHWFIHDSMTWRKNFWLMLFIEIIVILPHPYPTGLPPPMGDISEHPRLYDDKFGAFMFLRTYLILRVLRDQSKMYQRRYVLLNNRTVKKIGAVDFNWHFVIKVMFNSHKWTFVWIGLAYVWFVMAYVIWIYEREHNYKFDIVTAVWMTCITMATVGYGEVVATNGNARIASGIAATGGIILAALLVFSVIGSLSRSPQDVRAMNLLTRKSVMQKVKSLAASYLQLWWRRYKARCILLHSQGKKAPSFEPRITESKKPLSDTEFNQSNNFLKAKLRACRRTFSLCMDMEEMVTDRLSLKLDEVVDVIVSALALRLGIKPNFGAKNKVISLVEISGKAGVAFEDARKMRSKAEGAHKVLIEGSSSIF